ncbi:MAG: STAS domain-containing protein [Phycisphaerae bacterium]|nr:STAS domain-containing protein [Phycisphaerae bacterium]
MSEIEGIISEVEQDGTIIIRFNREQIFDIETAEELAVEFKRLVEEKGGRQWIIDFSGLELIITPVVSGLISALRSDREVGGDIYLCSMGETVKRVITLARLDRVFTVFETLEQALAAAKAKGKKPS